MSRRRRPSKRSHREPSTVVRKIVHLLTAIMVFFALVLAGFGIFWWLGERVFELKKEQNIVLVNNKIDEKEGTFYIIHISPFEPLMTVVKPKPTEAVEVLGGYGSYQLSKVYRLLELDKKDDRYLRAAFSWATGIVVDHVVLISEGSIERKKDVTALFGSQLYKQGVSLISIQQFSELYFFTRSMPEEKLTIKSDEIEIPALNKALYQPLNDECSIAVINTTEVPRLASRASTILENSGMVVVRVDDTHAPIERSSMSYDVSRPECELIGERIQAIFPERLEVADKPEQRQEHRADIVVFIGNDLGKLVKP